MTESRPVFVFDAKEAQQAIDQEIADRKELLILEAERDKIKEELKELERSIDEIKPDIYGFYESRYTSICREMREKYEKQFDTVT